MCFNYQNEDFPLKLPPYANIIKTRIKTKKHKSFDNHSYNNETPDLFRLDILKESKTKYHNPFLDNNDNTKLNRNEVIEQMSTTSVNHMNIINRFNASREDSQNPKLLKKIISESNCIKANKTKPIKLKDYSHTITQDNEGYNDILKEINRHYSKRLNYKQKKHINSSSNINAGGSLVIPSVSHKHIEKLTCSANLSSYLSNWSDYNIGEKDSEVNREIIFPRQNSTQYNPIKDTMEESYPSVIKNKHWSSFYENYTILSKQTKGFSKKGGLFTEYTDKNKTVIGYNQLEKKRNKIKKETLYLPPKPTTYVKLKMKLINKQCFAKPKKENISKVKKDSKVDEAKKVIEDKMLYKLKDIYTNVNYNHSYVSI